MTQTTSQVEAAVQRLMLIAGMWADEHDPLQCGRSNSLRDAIRAELASQQEVAAPVTQSEAAAKLVYDTWKDAPGYVPWSAGGNSLKQDEARRVVREVFAASRVPVASPGASHD